MDDRSPTTNSPPTTRVATALGSQRSLRAMYTSRGSAMLPSLFRLETKRDGVPRWRHCSRVRGAAAARVTRLAGLSVAGLLVRESDIPGPACHRLVRPAAAPLWLLCTAQGGANNVS